MKPFKERDVQPNAAGCVCGAIVAFISLCLVFAHPLAGLAFFVIGWIASAQINWFFCEDWKEGDPEYRSKVQPPAQMVYRREVTVSETIYAQQPLKPWELEDKLKRVNFREL
jgi:hypothetical protein